MDTPFGHILQDSGRKGPHVTFIGAEKCHVTDTSKRVQMGVQMGQDGVVDPLWPACGPDKRVGGGHYVAILLEPTGQVQASFVASMHSQSGANNYPSCAPPAVNLKACISNKIN